MQKVPYFESPPLHTVRVSTYPESSIPRDAEHGHVSSLPSTCDCVSPSLSSIVLASFYLPLPSRASILLDVYMVSFLLCSLGM